MESESLILQDGYQGNNRTVDDVENMEFLSGLLEAMYPELPAPKKMK